LLRKSHLNVDERENKAAKEVGQEIDNFAVFAFRRASRLREVTDLLEMLYQGHGLWNILLV